MKIALGDELVTVVKLVKKKVKTEDGETIEMVQVQITDRNLCDAGFKPDRSNAFHLAGRQKVKARIAWFQDHATERMVTVIAEPVKRAADARAKQAEPEAETSIQDKADRDNVLDHFRRVIRIAMGDELVELVDRI